MEIPIAIHLVDAREIETDRHDIEMPQSGDLLLLGYAIVVPIHPQPKVAPNQVVFRDDTVGITPIGTTVIDSQRLETIGRGLTRREESALAEQLATAIHGAVPVEIQPEESFLCPTAGPCDTFGSSVTVEIERDRREQIGGLNAIAVEIKYQWAGRARR
jgi:hypothetical protein